MNVARRYLKFERHILPSIFVSIVKQVEDDIGEVHLIYHANIIFCLERCLNLASCLFDLEREGIHYIVDQFVDRNIRKLEICLLTVEHRHLEHFFHLEAQALGLVGYDSTDVVEQCRRLVDRWVGEHLRSQRDGADRRFELVGHVVYEVVFHLAEFLLSEHHYDDKQKEDKHNE